MLGQVPGWAPWYTADSRWRLPGMRVRCPGQLGIRIVPVVQGALPQIRSAQVLPEPLLPNYGDELNLHWSGKVNEIRYTTIDFKIML